ncbi:MAG: hypothetical protein QM697_11375 [Lachnospiraceae bacterium]
MITILEEYTVSMLLSDENSREKLLVSFSEKMMDVFPRIIETYSLPEFEAVSEDKVYWEKQLKEIVLAIAQTDCFKIIDVLYFETRKNLLLYLGMINHMEIE